MEIKNGVQSVKMVPGRRIIISTGRDQQVLTS